MRSRWQEKLQERTYNSRVNGKIHSKITVLMQGRPVITKGVPTRAENVNIKWNSVIFEEIPKFWFNHKVDMWELYVWNNTSGKCPPRLCWDTCVLSTKFSVWHNCGGISEIQSLTSSFKAWMVVGLLVCTFDF